jgi:hypothetical protein
MEEFDDQQKLIESYALTILGKVILLEEKKTGRMSGLRVFCRLDVSIFREQATGSYSFFVNEITRTHGSGLFHGWIVHEQGDFLFEHLSEVLHLVAAQKLYLPCPPPP